MKPPVKIWKAAGVLANPEEAEQILRKQRQNARRTRASRERSTMEAERGWRDGLVRPWYITQLLDLHGMEGPEVDEACLAEEPEVDEWEAGTRYPRFDQLCALADLVSVLPHWFVMEHQLPMPLDRTSFWFHMSPTARKVYLDNYEPPVLRFTHDAYLAAGVKVPSWTERRSR